MRSASHLLQLALVVNLLNIQVVAASRNISFGSNGNNKISSCRTGSSISYGLNKSAFLVQLRNCRGCSYATSNNNLHRRCNEPRHKEHSRYSARSNLLLRSNKNDHFEDKSNPTQQAAPKQFTYTSNNEVTRRTILFNLVSLSLLTQIPSEAQSSSQIDATGQLYSPKNEMLSQGGSAAARGIKLPRKERKSTTGKNNNLLSTGGLIQDVYETRFVTYLTRFLLVFDPASSAWWKVCWKAVVWVLIHLCISYSK